MNGYDDDFEDDQKKVTESSKFYDEDFDDFEEMEIYPQNVASFPKSKPVSENTVERWKALSKFIQLDMSVYYELFDLFPSHTYTNQTVQAPDPSEIMEVDTQTTPIITEHKFTPSTGKQFLKHADITRLAPFIIDSTMLIERIIEEEESIKLSKVQQSVIGLSESFQTIDTLPGGNVLCFHVDTSFIYLSTDSKYVNIYSRHSLNLLKRYELNSFCTAMTSMDHVLICGCEDGSLLVYNTSSNACYASYIANFASVDDENRLEYHDGSIKKISISAKSNDIADIVSLDDGGNLGLWKLNLHGESSLGGCGYNSTITLGLISWLSHGCRAFCVLKGRIILSEKSRLMAINRFKQSISPEYFQTWFDSKELCHVRELYSSNDNYFIALFDESYLALYSITSSCWIRKWKLTEQLIDVSTTSAEIYAASKNNLYIFDVKNDFDCFKVVKGWNKEGNEDCQTEFKSFRVLCNMFNRKALRMFVVLISNNEIRLEMHSK